MAKLYTEKELRKLLAKGPAVLEVGRLSKDEHGSYIEIVEAANDGKATCKLVESSLFEDDKTESEDEKAAPQFVSNSLIPVAARVTTPKDFTLSVINFAKLIPEDSNGVLPGVVFEKKTLQIVQGILARTAKKEASGVRWVAGKDPEDQTAIRIWRV